MQHNRFLSECREKDPDVIFIGDCIFETLQHTDTWNSYFAPLHCLNFSIYEDRTQNVLWRLQNGELDNVKPKIVVLLVGTNNVQNTADEVAEGIIEIVKTIRDKLADAYIVLPVSFLTVEQWNIPKILFRTPDKSKSKFVLIKYIYRRCYRAATSRTLVAIETVPSTN